MADFGWRERTPYQTHSGQSTFGDENSWLIFVYVFFSPFFEAKVKRLQRDESCLTLRKADTAVRKTENNSEKRAVIPLSFC